MRTTVSKPIANTHPTACEQGEESHYTKDTPSPPRRRTEKVSLRLEGELFSWHSLAHVNRQLSLALLATGQVELSLIPPKVPEFTPGEYPRFAELEPLCFAPLSKPAVAHVRHFFPPRWQPPEEGHYVLVQPWEFGYLPLEWVAHINEQVSEVWCPSRYVYEVYRASGVPQEQLQIVPNGVDPDVFHPDAPPYIFTVEPGADRVIRDLQDRFIFLFTGGTLHRKGIDILLTAYRLAFTASDPVCLVIKDTGTRTVYRGMTEREAILSRVSDPSCPPILYLDDDFSDYQLAGVYTACDCLVQPYRGEGFCLPALEAMACGRPVLVPQGGATDDFVDETVGWRISAERRSMGSDRIGEWECAGSPWMLEINPDDLARLLKQVAAEREEVIKRGAAAAQRVNKEWTWQHASTFALARLEALQQLALPTHSRHAATAAPLSLPNQREVPDAGQTEGPHPQLHERKDTSLLCLTGADEPRISLCMIVKNEERVLADCLRSAKPWFDEIIVVDTGSTDRTVQIAESFGAKVFSFPWTDSFSEARNESLKHASGDWIFWMDADDTLPSTSGEAIRQAAKIAPPEIVGFVIPVQFVENGSAASGTRVDHVKLFRNLPSIAFEGRIHEQILASLRATGGQIARCEAVVLHSGYDTSPEGQAKKRARDYKLLQLDLAERPDHPFVLFNLGMTDHYTNRHEEAIAWLKKCLSVSPPGDSHIRKAYALLAVSLRELGRNEESLQTLQEGLRAVPGDPELHFQAGFLLTAQGRYAEAKAHYCRVVAADISAHFSSVDIGILGFKTYHNLGSVCQLMGDYEEAKSWWRKAIEAAPQFLPSICALFEAALERADEKTAQLMVEAAWQTAGASEEWATMSARYLERTEGGEWAEAFLKEAVTKHPAAVGPRLVLTRQLLQAEREEEAREHLETLNDQGVAEAAFYCGVISTRKGHLQKALTWMERALALSPGHLETQQQVTNLKQALASS